MKLIAPAIQRPARLAITSRIGRPCARRPANRIRASDKAGPICASRSPCRNVKKASQTLFGQVGAGQPMHADAGLPPHRAARGGWPCACARRARRESRRSCHSRHSASGIAGRCVAGIRWLAEQLPFRLGQERDVRRGGVALAAQCDQPGGQRAARSSSACGPGRTSSRRPVAGVNGTATCSLG